ncbi:carboxylesterase family protein [Actinomadura sp. WMMB 499]|uniref:carboxylesterase family protein n=1 Tax=Actinomadura sp. WMMB 499 TaxID=1219491 RepID=UPI00124832B9|nr:carboxylesterase family protein [Actinomadura sp. WMMB 499]QFG22696.1 carboxylesterase family protein [Actinomadura sp. WMMB 499]
MIAETGAGRVRGVAAPGGVTAFLGVPYARAGRFAVPGPARPWTGVRDAAAPGPAAPQTASRLERFQLVADGVLVPPDPVAVAGACGADVLAGVTGDEAAAFLAGDERVRALGPDDLAGVAAAWFGDPGRAAPDGRTAERIAVDMSTDHMFREPLARLARSLTEHGAPPWEYRFDWHPAGGPFGACHCIELPFVLGTAAAWRDAPMLAGERPAALVDRTRRAWAGFVRDGDPGWARGTARRFTG